MGAARSGTESSTEQGRRRGRAGRRAGYLVAVALNLALLWIAHQLLGWGWPGFLTGAFDDLLPWVTLSFVATAAVNVVWVAFDPPWFKHLAQMVLNVITLVVSVRSWQIFPFDFTGYPGWWDTAARVLLVIAIVGSAIGALVEAVQAARTMHDELGHPTTHHPHWA